MWPGRGTSLSDSIGGPAACQWALVTRVELLWPDKGPLCPGKVILRRVMDSRGPDRGPNGPKGGYCGPTVGLHVTYDPIVGLCGMICGRTGVPCGLGGHLWPKIGAFVQACLEDLMITH